MRYIKSILEHNEEKLFKKIKHPELSIFFNRHNIEIIDVKNFSKLKEIFKGLVINEVRGGGRLRSIDVKYSYLGFLQITRYNDEYWIAQDTMGGATLGYWLCDTIDGIEELWEHISGTKYTFLCDTIDGILQLKGDILSTSIKESADPEKLYGISTKMEIHEFKDKREQEKISDGEFELIKKLLNTKKIEIKRVYDYIYIYWKQQIVDKLIIFSKYSDDYWPAVLYTKYNTASRFGTPKEYFICDSIDGIVDLINKSLIKESLNKKIEESAITWVAKEGEKLYKQISAIDWYDFNEDHKNIDIREDETILKKLNPEKIKFSNFENSLNISIDIMVILEWKDDKITIRKYEDEYYSIAHFEKKLSRWNTLTSSNAWKEPKYYICDTIEGVIQFEKDHIYKSDWSSIKESKEEKLYRLSSLGGQETQEITNKDIEWIKLKLNPKKITSNSDKICAVAFKMDIFHIKKIADEYWFVSHYKLIRRLKNARLGWFLQKSYMCDSLDGVVELKDDLGIVD